MNYLPKILDNRGLKTPRQQREYAHPVLKYLKWPLLYSQIDKIIDLLREKISQNEKVFFVGKRNLDSFLAIFLLGNVLKEQGLNSFKIIFSEDKKELTKILSNNLPGLLVGIGIKEELVFELLKLEIPFLFLERVNKIGKFSEMDENDFFVFPSPVDTALASNLNLTGLAFKLAEALVLSYDSDFFWGRNLVALDLETTGLNPWKNEIMEIGVSTYFKGKLKEKWGTFIKIKGEIPLKIQQLCGIYPEDLREKGIPLEQALKELSPKIEGAVLIGNNIKAFDLRFLKASYQKIGLPLPVWEEIRDNLILARKLFPNRRKSLGELVKFLDFDLSSEESCDFHRASFDARMSARIYFDFVKYKSLLYRNFVKNQMAKVALSLLFTQDMCLGENRIWMKWGESLLANDKLMEILSLNKNISKFEIVEIFHKIIENLPNLVGGEEIEDILKGKVLSLKVEKNGIIRNNGKLEKIVGSKNLSSKIDLEINFQEIGLEMFELLKKMEPFGPGNEYPLFLIKDIPVVETKIFTYDYEMVKMKTEKEFVEILGIEIKKERLKKIMEKEKINIKGYLKKENWEGKTKVQIILKDIL